MLDGAIGCADLLGRKNGWQLLLLMFAAIMLTVRYIEPHLDSSQHPKELRAQLVFISLGVWLALLGLLWALRKGTNLVIRRKLDKQEKKD
tara:strand:+ start:494 stop:763 length:270 start_codon:yes stop_codon:yes gene_type:complete